MVYPDARYRLAVFRSADPGADVEALLPVDRGVMLRTATGEPVGVGLRGLLTARPEVVEIRRRCLAVLSWSRPWPVDETWWEPARTGDGEVGVRPRARIQLVPECTAALLLTGALGDESGRWTVEGVYE